MIVTGWQASFPKLSSTLLLEADEIEFGELPTDDQRAKNEKYQREKERTKAQTKPQTEEEEDKDQPPPVSRPPLIEPIYPSPDECCGSGCSPCVYDIYYQRLEEYKIRKMEEESEESDCEGSEGGG